MNLLEAIKEFRAYAVDVNPPADARDLGELERVFGRMPEQALILYRGHNGSDSTLRIGGRGLAARLMPIQEVIGTRAAIIASGHGLPTVGPVAWLWTDDNSNYCGIYTAGRLCGWLYSFDHEEPALTPAFRSVASFMSCLLSEAHQTERGGTHDLLSVPHDVPKSIRDVANDELDQELASYFREQHRNESDKALRRLYAFCSICLTPFEHTSDVMPFLEEQDTWIPEAAVRLLEIRQWKAGTEELVKLAREGSPNGDSAAMRLLVRMNTDDSQQAIRRLKQYLQGQKLRTLEMWTRPGIDLQPPAW